MARTTTSRSSAASAAASARITPSPSRRSRCRNSRSWRRATRRSSAGRRAAWSTPSRSPEPTSSAGSLFYVNRNRDWAEKNAFGQNAAPTQQQYGGSIGGPVAKDQLFYFAAAESQNFKNNRAVVFNLTGIARNGRQRRGVRLLPLARDAVRNDQRCARAPRPRSTTSCRRRTPQHPLQLQRQRREERERDGQRPGRHDRQRAVEQRHGKRPDQHLRRPVHDDASLERAAGSSRPVFEGESSTGRQRVDPARDRCRRQLRHGELPRPERAA